MRIAFVGPHHLIDPVLVAEAFADSDWADRITQIVTTGAEGLEREAERWAHQRKIAVCRYPVATLAQHVGAAVIVWDGLDARTQGVMAALQEAGKGYFLKQVATPLPPATVEVRPVLPSKPTEPSGKPERKGRQRDSAHAK